jgi:hypothetical protein
MKNILIKTLFIVMCAVPWACNRHNPVGPVPPIPPAVTPTPTVTVTSTPMNNPTPGCGFTAIQIPSPVITPTAYTFYYPGIGNPVPGNKYVIRSLSDWQNYYGGTSLPAPSVNFASQMILINLQNYTAGYSTSPISVCWTSTQVTVSCMSFTYTVPIPIVITPIIPFTPVPTATPVPWDPYAIALVVPLSNLPVTWIYTEGLDAL